MNEISRLWIEAANILFDNPQEIVSCPECKVGKLKVTDEPIENKIDRYMICDKCGKYNVLTMSKPNN
jgi:uncharacterized protein with PIN domain